MNHNVSANVRFLPSDASASPMVWNGSIFAWVLFGYESYSLSLSGCRCFVEREREDGEGGEGDECRGWFCKKEIVFPPLSLFSLIRSKRTADSWRERERR